MYLYYMLAWCPFNELRHKLISTLSNGSDKTSLLYVPHSIIIIHVIRLKWYSNLSYIHNVPTFPILSSHLHIHVYISKRPILFLHTLVLMTYRV